MKSLIIYAHPWDGSFNRKVLDDIETLLSRKGKQVDVIDLHKDGFNPVMTTDDLKLFGRGEYSDPLARDYVERIKRANEIIFIYPIWWYGEPAILKGFFDKVFLKGQTYIQKDFAIAPLLNIKNSTVITTASIEEEALIVQFGDPIGKRFIGGVLAMVGITNTKWLHCGAVHLEDNRNQFMQALNARFK